MRKSLNTTSAIKSGNSVIGLPDDMSGFERIKTVFDAADGEMHKIDIPVFNTDVYNGGTLADVTEEQFDQIGNVNFKGVVFSIKKALPFLKEVVSVIITVFIMSTMGMPAVTAHFASIAAVQRLAKSFSALLSDRRIRVDVLSPVIS